MRRLEEIREELFTSFCLVISITMAFLGISLLMAVFPLLNLPYFTRFLVLFSSLLLIGYSLLFREIFFLKNHTRIIFRFIRISL